MEEGFFFELDLNVTQSDHEDENENDYHHDHAEELTFPEEICYDNLYDSDLSLNSQNSYSYNFYLSQREIELNRVLACQKIQRVYRGYCRRKWTKRVRTFTNKMAARKRLGAFNIIKRIILKKGLRQRSTTALRLLKLTLIQDKLQKSKSIYY